MIRTYTHEDVKALGEMARDMMQESPRFRDMPLSPDKFYDVLSDSIFFPDSHLCLVVEREGEIVGSLYGVISEYYFNTQKMACEYWLYVKPEFRGKLIAERLIKAYVAWAKRSDVKEIQLGVSTGVHPEETSRLYEKLGFNRIGNIHAMRI